ncbi:MAG TPA: hypothetical protein VMB52_01835 [Verrucomicrobiae bacterium]|nr:hypothetical protein [Verrucomicrobiae bacterium]
MSGSQHGASLWHIVIGFSNSSFFVAAVTLVVGFFAIYVYRKQKRDEKMRAARIILLEVRNAEKQLKEARVRINEAAKNDLQIVPERLYAMPTNSWRRLNYLFVKDFSSDG